MKENCGIGTSEFEMAGALANLGPLCRSCCHLDVDHRRPTGRKGRISDWHHASSRRTHCMVIVWSLLGRSHSTPRYSRCYPSRRSSWSIVAERQYRRLIRREYAVQGPMHLWHADRNHKLVHYNWNGRRRIKIITFSLKKENDECLIHQMRNSSEAITEK